MDASKNLARALRRHHARRLKKTRQAYWGGTRDAHSGFAWTPRRLGMVLATPQPCSCLGCGNQRRWLGEATMQERRLAQHSVAELLCDVPPAND